MVLVSGMTVSKGGGNFGLGIGDADLQPSDIFRQRINCLAKLELAASKLVLDGINKMNNGFVSDRIRAGTRSVTH